MKLQDAELYGSRMVLVRVIKYKYACRAITYAQQLAKANCEVSSDSPNESQTSNGQAQESICHSSRA
jgi:hypothetical protein